MITLGWKLNMRMLIISLPKDKFLAWSNNLIQLIKRRRVTFGNIQCLEGRLSHISYIILPLRNFLTDVYFWSKLDSYKNKIINLSKEEIETFKLWVNFLETANNGILLNLIVHCRPTQLIIFDSFPFSLGGFLWNSSKVWRLQIPKLSPIYGYNKVNNILEYLAMVISILLRLNKCLSLDLLHECILLIGDSTSAIGWLFKSSQIDRSLLYFTPIRFISRHLAK